MNKGDWESLVMIAIVIAVIVIAAIAGIIFVDCSINYWNASVLETPARCMIF